MAPWVVSMESANWGCDCDWACDCGWDCDCDCDCDCILPSSDARAACMDRICAVMLRWSVCVRVCLGWSGVKWRLCRPCRVAG